VHGNVDVEPSVWTMDCKNVWRGRGGRTMRLGRADLARREVVNLIREVIDERERLRRVKDIQEKN
jgi:hypothetical protein